MITFTTAQNSNDLQQILDLQGQNLPEYISIKEAKTEGFVTVKHDLSLLKAMNKPYPHIIVKKDHNIVGYALVMLPKFSEKIEVLKPMFEQLNMANFKNEKLSNYNYFVMGQICIEKTNRKKGLFTGLYNTMKSSMQNHFDCVVTEVDKNNERSLAAHYKVGFKKLKEYTSRDRKNWILLIWNWSCT
jgi:hypothetical protein